MWNVFRDIRFFFLCCFLFMSFLCARPVGRAPFSVVRLFCISFIVCMLVIKVFVLLVLCDCFMRVLSLLELAR